MEFEDEHDEEQEEEDDEDEDEITIPPPAPVVVPNSVVPPSRPRVSSERRSGVVRYRECLKNHAVSIGGHAVDGCGEFMAAGEEGTFDALKCAACNCHRNFHRKEVDYSGETPPTAARGGVLVNQQHHNPVAPTGGTPSPTSALYPQFSAYYRTPALPTVSGYPHYRPPFAGPASTSDGTTTYSGEMGDDMSNPSSSGGGGEGRRDGGDGMLMVPRKRFRTKFTQDQKDKMLAFAEKLGWRIQKHDEAAVQQFCAELQIKRQVLKVWMHNNKYNTLGTNKP